MYTKQLANERRKYVNQNEQSEKKKDQEISNLILYNIVPYLQLLDCSVVSKSDQFVLSDLNRTFSKVPDRNRTVICNLKTLV